MILKRGVATSLLAGLLFVSAATASQTRLRLSLLVLGVRDVPTGFRQEERGSLDNARASILPPTASMADERKWGRLAGYTTAFRKRSHAVGIVAAIRSSVSLYGNPRSARAAVAARGSCNGGGLTLHRVALGGLSAAVQLACNGVSTGPRPIHIYVVVWQRRALVGSVIASGPRGVVTTQQMEALARAQDSLMTHR
jgi:hypothetical protein